MDNWLQLSEVARLAQGRLYGEDRSIAGISTDTRRLHGGDLFVALQGERFDGHEFIGAAIEQIVKGVLVHRTVDTTLPLILVDDTLKALARWAKAWRHMVSPKLVAVTGSNGKTTVKQMLANVLSLAGSACHTQGNLNNHIGVPLTLLTLRRTDRYAVIEMGANHFGEIDCLSRLAVPDVAIITNAGPAHLDGFGSIAGVAQAKGEIINGVKAHGTIVLNADDQYLPLWQGKSQHLNTLTFGFGAHADVRGVLTQHNRLTVTHNALCFDIELAMPGKHNASNALAVAAAAISLGIGREIIKTGLESARQVAARLQTRPGMSGATIIDDSYNANPASLQAAIDVLCDQPKEPWLVLGDMGELGQQAAPLHARMGQQAKSAGVKKIFTLGRLAAHAAAAFGKNGRCFNTHAALSKALLDQMHANCCILIKGSRLMRMEDVVGFLVESDKLH